MTLILQSTLTCPNCGTQTAETMPTDACVYFHTCSGCGVRLRPKPGDCCIFCSYGSVPCPPIQESGGRECCAGAPDSAVPAACSLEPGAFRERMSEIATLMRTFGGVMERTQGGMELRFKAGDGVRTALEALAEKERACCASLEFTVGESAGSIALIIEGIAGDRAAIDELAASLVAAQA